MYALTRRDFLRAACALTLSGVPLVPTNAFSEPSEVEAESANAILSGLTRLGESYLKSQDMDVTEDSNKKLLTRLGLAALPSGDANLPLPTDFLDHYEQQIRDDIIYKRFCNLDGWQLAESECVLSALAFIQFGVATPDAANSNAKGNTNTEIAIIEDWGPKSTKLNQPFNQQPNGNSALWIKVNKYFISTESIKVFFGSLPMQTTLHTELITADLNTHETTEATQLSTKHEIYLVDTVSGIRQQIGVFTVMAGDKQLLSSGPDDDYLPCYLNVPDGELADIVDWGPRTTKIEEHFNLQPEGDSAFWVKVVKKHDDNYQLALGDLLLFSRNHPHDAHQIITATVKDYLVEVLVNSQKEIPLFIVVEKKKQLIGIFSVK